MPDIVFVSLGMFIIDTIVDAKGSRLEDVIGGAGTYAAVGSRLFTEPRETGFLVDYGNDLPPLVESTIASLGLALDIRRDEDRQCTRGLNIYKDGIRHFEYLTPKIRITPGQLSPAFLASKSFHLICAPLRCISVVEELRDLRRQASLLLEPLIIWEPVPDSCIPENKDDFERAIKYVDIVSPNMDEVLALLGSEVSADSVQIKRQVERAAAEISDVGVKTVIIRCSSLGAYICSKALSKWYPPAITDPAQVVDATGAGNTFCGALVTRLAQSASMDEAMSRASVAAGLSIQQVGLPNLQVLDGLELWNGADMETLVSTYRTS